MYECKGTAYTVKQLIELLEGIPKGINITAAGGVLHVITLKNEFGVYEGIVIEDDDYAEEWNEEFGYIHVNKQWI